MKRIVDPRRLARPKSRGVEPRTIPLTLA